MARGAKMPKPALPPADSPLAACATCVGDQMVDGNVAADDMDEGHWFIHFFVVVA
jgi:hypothetical protein